MSKYDDIINLNRPLSKHPHLSIDSRASQFAPFAALVGYDLAVKEMERHTEQRISLDEDRINKINNILLFLNENLNNKYEVVVTYFIKDKLKDGGKYIDKEGIIKKIDRNKKTIIFDDNIVIFMKDIIDINGDIVESILFG